MVRQIKEQDRLAKELEQMRQLYESPLQYPQTSDDDSASLAGDRQQRQLVTELRNFLLDNSNYAKIEIDRDELVAALSTNRTSLSEAVRAVTEKRLWNTSTYCGSTKPGKCSTAMPHSPSKPLPASVDSAHAASIACFANDTASLQQNTEKR